MNNSALISIILPNYNSEEYLQNTIDSIINQTYDAWELFFIDDCSTDNSLDIIHKLSEKDNRINVIKSKIASGRPSVPRNLGLNHCNGQYIAFIDSDDLWHPQKLELQYNLMMLHNKEFCFSNVFPFKSELNVQSFMDQIIDESLIRVSSLTHKQLINKNYIKSCSSVLLKSSLIINQYFNEDRKYKAVEDWLFWLHLHQYGIYQSLWIKEDLVYYRIHQNSISNSKINMIKNTFFMYSNYNLNNKPLGLAKYYYFINYSIRSIFLIIKYKLKGIAAILGKLKR